MRSGERWNTSIAARSTLNTSLEPGSASWPSNWQLATVTVSAVSYDEMAGYELEVTFVRRISPPSGRDRPQPDW